MARVARTLPDELLAYLSTVQVDVTPLAPWLAASARFTEFVDAHRAKIRKKLRTAEDAEGVRDVLCEVETAYRLLREPRIALEYEAAAQRLARGPDFSVTWRTHTLCHVEAARLRAATPGGERLHEVVCNKLGQMQPSAMNVLVIATGAALPTDAEVEQSLKQLQARAEQGDAA